MVGLVDDLDDVFFGTLTSWIDQDHHFLKLPMRLVLKILELTRDLGVNSQIQEPELPCFFLLCW